LHITYQRASGTDLLCNPTSLSVQPRVHVQVDGLLYPTNALKQYVELWFRATLDLGELEATSKYGIIKYERVLEARRSFRVSCGYAHCSAAISSIRRSAYPPTALRKRAVTDRDATVATRCPGRAGKCRNPPQGSAGMLEHG
jgi:hypothetical protein